MSSHNIPSNDPLDNYIARCLKNWLWYQDPPKDSKEMLLQSAHRQSREGFVKITMWKFFSQNVLLVLNRIISALSNLYVPSPSYIEISYSENSMRRNMSTRETIFRSFPTRMAYFCLIS